MRYNNESVGNVIGYTKFLDGNRRCITDAEYDALTPARKAAVDALVTSQTIRRVCSNTPIGNSINVFGPPVSLREGIEEQDAPQPALRGVRVFPSPVSRMLTIESDEADFSYILRDALGRVVAKGHTENASKELDCSNLTAGAYLLQVQGAQCMHHTKVIVTR